jgi:hypothetical protein
MGMSRKYIFIIFGAIFTVVYCFLMMSILGGKPEKGKTDARFALEKTLYTIYAREYTKSHDHITLPRKQQNERLLYGVCREFISYLLEKNNNQFTSYWAGLPDSIVDGFDIALMKRNVTAASRNDFDSLFLFPERLVFPINLFPFYISFLSHCDTSFFSDVALFDAIKRAAIIYHDRGYIVAADTLFKVLESRFHNKDPELRAWHGSVVTKFALTVLSPVDKVDFVAKGVAMIDGAQSISPKNLTIRFIRYFNFLELPSFFKKRSIIMNDIRFLQKEFLEGGRLEIVDRGKIRDTVIAQDDIGAALSAGIASPNLTANDKTELRRFLAQVTNGGK